MNILVVGCGKVGSCLANQLSRAGHDVVVIDREQEHFSLLDDDFSGFTVEGIEIDQDVLQRAGIRGCDTVVAVSPDDNVNIMVSQIARELFQTQNVIARINDPKRKDVFSHFDLKTICSTNLTVEAVYSLLMNTDEPKQLTFDSTVVDFDTLPVPRNMLSVAIEDIPSDGESMLFAVLHANGSLTLCGNDNGSIRTQEGDRLIFAKIVD